MLGKTIGRGKYGRVKRAVDLVTKEYVAVKVIPRLESKDCKDDKQKAALKRLMKEVTIHELLDHPHIVRVLAQLSTKKFLYVVMELCPRGEIFDYVVAHGRLREAEARRFFRQLVSAMDYCHSLGIVHRDLKLENILLGSSFDMKLADFGFSSAFDAKSYLSTFCGTASYAAPEILNGRKYHGPEVDIWSMGVLLYCFVCGGMPYPYDQPRDIKEALNRGDTFEKPSVLTRDCINLLSHMMTIEVAKRATMAEVRCHPWVTDNGQLPPVPENRPQEAAVSRSTVNANYLERIRLMGYPEAEIENALYERAGPSEIRSIYHLLEQKYDPRPTLPPLVRATSDPITPTPPAGARETPVPAPRPRRNTIAAPDDPNAPTAPGILERRRRAASHSTRQAPGAPGPLGAVVEEDAEYTELKTIPAHVHHHVRSPVPHSPVPSELPVIHVTTTTDKGKEEEVVVDPLDVSTASTPGRLNKTMPAIVEDASSEEGDIDHVGAGVLSGPLAVPSGERLARRVESGEQQDSPRSIRTAFSAESTSALPPEEIRARTLAALEHAGLHYTVNHFTISVDGPDGVKMEVEICAVPRLSLHYLRFKRVEGTVWDYKRLRDATVSNVNL